MGARTSISSLSDDLLRQILLLVPPSHRIRTVPLVCHRWCDVVAEGSMWPSVDMVLCERNSAHAGGQDSWLPQRGSGIRQLILTFPKITTALVNTRLVQRTLASMVQTATLLQELQFISNTEDRHAFGIEALACASHLRSLTRLEANFISTPLERPFLDELFAGLPELRDVRLLFCTYDDEDHPSDSENEADWRQSPPSPQYIPSAQTIDRSAYPDDVPHSLLKCTRLTSLDFSMYYPVSLDTMFTVGNAEALTALQQLRQLRLGCCVTATLTREMSRLTQLTRLQMIYENCHLGAESGEPDELDPEGLEALPTSLVELDAERVPLRELARLTALERLTLSSPRYSADSTCGPGMLQSLTSLHLDCSDAAAQINTFAGCTGLRELSLSAASDQLDMAPFQQLTRLSLDPARLPWADILAMIAGLPQLEQLDVIASRALELSAADVVPLSRVPMLRLVNLYDSQLWRDDLHMHPIQDIDQPYYLPRGIVQHLLYLQRVLPHIEFVVDDLQPFDWRKVRAVDLK